MLSALATLVCLSGLGGPGDGPLPAPARPADAALATVAERSEYKATARHVEVIAQLDDSNAKAALAQTKANLVQAELAYKNIIPIHDRNEKLAVKGWISANDLDQSRANRQLAQSNLTFTESDLKRAQQLVTEKTITEQVFEQRSQAFRNAQASFAAASAAVRQAELDMQFTELRAPIDGRIGDRRVSPGNLVTGGTSGNTTLLATIVSQDPIHFEFTFDEASYLRYERMAKEGADVASRGPGVNVSLKLIDEKDFTHEGRMDFVDNAIDRSTGTIRGRALFKNPNSVFTPGMFARVRVPASPPYQALLVPDTALGTEQAKRYLLVVGADDMVTMKYVIVGQVVDGGLRVIKEGLAADDRVIVEGLMRARAGIKVTPQEQAAKAEPQKK